MALDLEQATQIILRTNPAGNVAQIKQQAADLVSKAELLAFEQERDVQEAKQKALAAEIERETNFQMLKASTAFDPNRAVDGEPRPERNPNGTRVVPLEKSATQIEIERIEAGIFASTGHGPKVAAPVQRAPWAPDPAADRELALRRNGRWS